MDNINLFFQELYTHFNERRIDLVIAHMAEDVKWANGMEGGYVYGHKGVREYWTRQFSMVDSNVVPLTIEQEKEIVKVKVHQVVRDLHGMLLADEIVYHFFRLQNNKVAEFQIGEKAKA